MIPAQPAKLQDVFMRNAPPALAEGGAILDDIFSRHATELQEVRPRGPQPLQLRGPDYRAECPGCIFGCLVVVF